MNTKSKLMTATAAAAAIAVSAGGAAYASSGTPAPSKTPPAASAPRPGATPRLPAATTLRPAATSRGAVAGTFLRDHPRLRREIRRILLHSVHAEFVVHTRMGYVTLDVDRGTVTSVSSGSITVTRADGPSVQSSLTARTHYFGLPQGSINTGDKAIVAEVGGNAVVVASKAPSTTSGSAA